MSCTRENGDQNYDQETGTNCGKASDTSSNVKNNAGASNTPSIDVESPSEPSNLNDSAIGPSFNESGLTLAEQNQNDESGSVVEQQSTNDGSGTAVEKLSCTRENGEKNNDQEKRGNYDKARYTDENRRDDNNEEREGNSEDWTTDESN